MAMAWLRKWGATFDFLGSRSKAYKHVFLGNGYGELVMQDMMRHCHATDTTFDPNPQVQAFKEGQRDAWLRIERHLHLTPEQLFIIYNHPSVVAQYVSQEEPNE